MRRIKAKSYSCASVKNQQNIHEKRQKIPLPTKTTFKVERACVREGRRVFIQASPVRREMRAQYFKQISRNHGKNNILGDICDY